MGKIGGLIPADLTVEVVALLLVELGKERHPHRHMQTGQVWPQTPYSLYSLSDVKQGCCLSADYGKSLENITP